MGECKAIDPDARQEGDTVRMDAAWNRSMSHATTGLAMLPLANLEQCGEEFPWK